MVERCRKLMRRHCDAVPSGAAGSSSLPSGVSSFAETMAAWRFYRNERIEMSELIEPLREYARRQLAATHAGVVMLVHDWCKLSDPGHASKKDQAQLAQANNRGYELTTVLAVSGTDGAPLAPVEVHFKTGDGVLSTRAPAPPDVHHLEQVRPTMDASHEWNLGCPALHVIDREADSVGHFRAWQAGGHHFLVRGREHRIVTWEGRPIARRKIGAKSAKSCTNAGISSIVAWRNITAGRRSCGSPKPRWCWLNRHARWSSSGRERRRGRSSGRFPVHH